MRALPTSLPLRIAARMARAGACAEMWLTETGYANDAWSEIGLVVEPDGTVRLLPEHGEESAVELLDALGCAGARTRHDIGPVAVAMPESLTRDDPWSRPRRPLPLPLPWTAAIGGAAAHAVLADIAAHRRLRHEILPLVWLARACTACLDRRARLRAAPRLADATPRRNVVTLHRAAR